MFGPRAVEIMAISSTYTLVRFDFRTSSFFSRVVGYGFGVFLKNQSWGKKEVTITIWQRILKLTVG